MIEHRTHPLSHELMLAELIEICAKLVVSGVELAAVSFGWDSNLDIDDMWVDVEVSLTGLPEYLSNAERAGTIEIGKADIFIKTEDIWFTLCHESDLHITGTSPLVAETRSRWSNLGYELLSRIPLNLVSNRSVDSYTYRQRAAKRACNGSLRGALPVCAGHLKC